MSSFYLYYKESLDVRSYTTLIELDGFNIFETNYFNTGNNKSMVLIFPALQHEESKYSW